MLRGLRWGIVLAALVGLLMAIRVQVYPAHAFVRAWLTVGALALGAAVWFFRIPYSSDRLLARNMGQETDAELHRDRKGLWGNAQFMIGISIPSILAAILTWVLL